MLEVVYFASIRERIGIDSEQIAFVEGERIAQLRDRLSDLDEGHQSALSSAALLVAVNKSMATLETSLEDGDEIAFFPPVTGG